MDSQVTQMNRTVLPREFETLTEVEKLVYVALAVGGIKSDDIAQLAKNCKLTNLQVIVAIQLLIHKKMLPKFNDT